MAGKTPTGLEKLLAQVVERGDRASLLDASEPRGTALAVIGQGSVLLLVGYLPVVAEQVRLQDAWLPALLTLLGGGCTYFAWRRRLQGLGALVATHLDNTFYSLALVLAASRAAPPWDLALATVHGLMVLSFPAQHYPLVPSVAVTMALPLVAVGIASPPRPVVGLVLVATYVMTLVLMQYTSHRHASDRERERLREAFLATRTLADESTQLALGSLALSMGHLVHELRNQMAAQRINLELLKDMVDLDEDAREALDDTLSAQRRQETLLQEVVATASRRAGADSSQSTFDVRRVLEDRGATLAPKDLAVEVHVATGEQAWIAGSPAHLEVALTNLLRNAHQAGASRARLELRPDDDGRISLSIADDGKGLPDHLRDDMFSAFGESTKADGSGLGLYLTRRYVELLGGTVSVGDSPLGGAAFLISLPLASPGARDGAKPS